MGAVRVTILIMQQNIQSVEQIKNNKLNHCMIKMNELITILNEMKEIKIVK